MRIGKPKPKPIVPKQIQQDPSKQTAKIDTPKQEPGSQTGILTSKKEVQYKDTQKPQTIAKGKPLPQRGQIMDKPSTNTEIKKQFHKKKVPVQQQTQAAEQTAQAQTEPSGPQGPTGTSDRPQRPPGEPTQPTAPRPTRPQQEPAQPQTEPSAPHGPAGTQEGPQAPTQGPAQPQTEPSPPSGPAGTQEGPQAPAQEPAPPQTEPSGPQGPTGASEGPQAPARPDAPGRPVEETGPERAQGARQPAEPQSTRRGRVADALEDLRPSAYQRGGSYREMNADYHAGRWFQASNHGQLRGTSDNLGRELRGASDQDCRQYARDYMERNAGRYEHYTPEQRSRTEEGLSRFLMQRRQGNQPAPGRVDDAAYGRVRQNIERRANNIHISDQEATNAHRELMNMSPRDADATLQRMDRDGLLDNYMNEASDSQRREMVQHLERGGVLRSRPQGRVNMVEDNNRYPQEMRQAIWDTNRSRYQGQVDRYEQESARWRDQVSRARTVPELRDIGPAPERPVSAEMLSNDPAVSQRWQDEVRSDLHGQTTDIGRHNQADLDNRVAVVTGRSYPGIHADVGVQVSRTRRVGNRRVNVSGTGSAGGQVSIDQDGRVTRRATGGGSVAGDVGRGNRRVGVSHGGQIHHDTQGIGEGAVDSTTRERVTNVRVGPLEARRTTNIPQDDNPDRRPERQVTDRVGVDIPVFTSPTAEASVTAAGEVGVGDRPSVRIVAEPNVMARVGRNEEVEVRGTAAVGVRGVRAEDSLGSPTGNTFYSIPRELQQNRRWQDLPAERRRDLAENLAWSEQEWEDRRARMHPATD